MMRPSEMACVVDFPIRPRGRANEFTGEKTVGAGRLPADGSLEEQKSTLSEPAR